MQTEKIGKNRERIEGERDGKEEKIKRMRLKKIEERNIRN